ncbi:MAG: mycofactocin system transcriptional regulator [Acidimicrobiales bacterium]
MATPTEATNRADEGLVAPDTEVARGRPASTTRQDVARAALDLFARQGYDDTTVDEIASAVGISRRTFFRYYEAKPDVVWGEFDTELERLRDSLSEAPDEEPLMEVLRRSVIATNRFGAGELDELRIRMVLISSVPTLVAHSAVRYEEWCDVVAEFAAARIGGSPGDLGPQTVARASLGAAMAAFACWAKADDGDLATEVDRAFRLLATGFDPSRFERGNAAPGPT